MADEIVLITDITDIEIIDDRVQFTVQSGRRNWTYSISKHRSRNAIHVTLRALDKHDRECNVREFKR